MSRTKWSFEGCSGSPLLEYSHCGSDEDGDRPSPCLSSGTPTGSGSRVSQDSFNGEASDCYLLPPHTSSINLMEYPVGSIVTHREMERLRLQLEEATRLLADKDETLQGLTAELAAFKALYKETILHIPSAPAHEGLTVLRGTPTSFLQRSGMAVGGPREQPVLDRPQLACEGAPGLSVRERGSRAFGWRGHTSSQKKAVQKEEPMQSLNESSQPADIIMGSWDVCNVW